MASCFEIVTREFAHTKFLGSNKLDVIIFGATGSIGFFTVVEAVTVLRHFSWGVAGRNREKLEIMLEYAGMQTRRNLSKIPIFIANAMEDRSLVLMARHCRVIINCTSPVHLYGEAVIEACIAEGTHYVDMCVESRYMEMIQYKYDEEAKIREVFIVPACGLQSLPIDLGISYLTDNFKGTINSIEAYIQFETMAPLMFGAIGSKSAWASLILAATSSEKSYKRGMPRMTPKLDSRPLMHQSEIVNGYCLPSPMVNKAVVDRTQFFLYEEIYKRPIQFKEYLVIRNQLLAFVVFIWYMVIAIMASMSWTRKLLLKFPGIFSFGLFSAEELSEERMENTMVTITLNAMGWSNISKNTREEFHDKPNKSTMARISGINPLPGAACVCVLASALTILTERSKIPGRGGVYTPGSAFGNTNIINELEKHEHGLRFEIYVP